MLIGIIKKIIFFVIIPIIINTIHNKENITPEKFERNHPFHTNESKTHNHIHSPIIPLVT